MTETLGFNTGRRYTQHGQRVSYQALPDGRVRFNDHDRMIFGVTTHPVVVCGKLTPRAVMQAYDGGHYVWDAEASHLDAGSWGHALCV